MALSSLLAHRYQYDGAIKLAPGSGLPDKR
jgi:hypothetical protein